MQLYARQCAASLLLMLGGCVAVSGGAVEAGWELRAPHGQLCETNEQCRSGRCDQGICQGVKLSCDQARLGAVRIIAEEPQTSHDACAVGDRCLFDCDRDIGTTRFEIPEGQYLFSVRAVDLGSKTLTPADGVVVPPAVQGRVRSGELTNLGVNLIIVDR